MDGIMRTMAFDLLEATNGCRADMHEPDEQGIDARVVGTSFDNAMGSTVTPSAIIGGYQEMVLIIDRRGGSTMSFNVASLVALARIGAQAIIEGKEEI